MKKHSFYILIAALAAVFQSCDYVANPSEAISGGGSTDSSTHERRVLVEDYTGHKCPNCPQAAIAATQLKNTYGEKVVVVSVHAGFFAVPTTPAGAPSGSYLNDYRTTAGTAYDSPTYFGISNVGNPNGMINRKDYTPSTTTHVKAYGTWPTEVAALMALPPVADLKITNTYNASTRSLSINTSSEFISDTLTTGSYKLIVMITQDSIIDWQVDGSVNNPTYVHQHMLRDNVNGTWGDVLTTGTVTPHASITKNYTYTLPATYNGTACDEKHCYVVAFIYNTANYEVLQAAEEKVE